MRNISNSPYHNFINYSFAEVFEEARSSVHAIQGTLIQLGVSIICLLSYILIGRQAIFSISNPNVDIIVLATMCCFIFLSFLNLVKAIVQCERFRNNLKKNIVTELEMLRSRVSSAEFRLKHAEQNVSNNFNRLSGRGVRSLDNAARVVMSLKQRTAKLEYYLDNATTDNLLNAKKLLEKKIITTGSTVNTLSTSSDIDQIKAKDWEKITDLLLTDVEYHVESVAAA